MRKNENSNSNNKVVYTCIHCGKKLNNLFACSKVPSCKKSENEACVQFVCGTVYIPSGCIFYYTVSLTV